jgi:hypothetical protein
LIPTDTYSEKSFPFLKNVKGSDAYYLPATALIYFKNAADISLKYIITKQKIIYTYDYGSLSMCQKSGTAKMGNKIKLRVAL